MDLCYISSHIRLSLQSKHFSRKPKWTSIASAVIILILVHLCTESILVQTKIDLYYISSHRPYPRSSLHSKHFSRNLYYISSYPYMVRNCTVSILVTYKNGLLLHQQSSFLYLFIITQ